MSEREKCKRLMRKLNWISSRLFCNPVSASLRAAGLLLDLKKKKKDGSQMRENGVANALQFNLGVQDNYNQFQPPAKVLYASTLNPR